MGLFGPVGSHFKIFVEYSVPLETDIVPRMQELCKGHGMEYAPRILCCRHSSMHEDTEAFPKENTILIREHTFSTLNQEILEGILARDVGKIVMKGCSPEKADRFALFLTNNSPGLADYIQKEYGDARTNYESASTEKPDKQNGIAFAVYPPENCEKRLNKLSQPLTEREITSFKKAIAAYNERMAPPEDREHGSKWHIFGRHGKHSAR